MQQSNIVILVTGGSAGIGLATAKLLAVDGAYVYAGSRRGEIVGIDLDEYSGRLIPVKMDVNCEEDSERVVSQIIAFHGRLDAIVCCAGNGIAGSVEDTTADEARYQFETNFFGTIKSVRSCLPVFRKQGHGRIITVSSVAAVIPIPFQTYYSCVKSSVLMYSQALSLEVKRLGIQCCCILPGDVKTDFTASRKFAAASQSPDSPYYDKTKASVGKMEHDEQNGMSPDFIAKAIFRQIHKRRMSPTSIPRLDYKLFALLSRILPRRLMLRIVGMVY